MFIVLQRQFRCLNFIIDFFRWIASRIMKNILSTGEQHNFHISSEVERSSEYYGDVLLHKRRTCQYSSYPLIRTVMILNKIIKTAKIAVLKKTIY